MVPDPHESLPRISPGRLRAFAAYARWYLRRQVHAVRLDLEGFRPDLRPGWHPQVVFLNHAAWHDPLVCLLLAGAIFPGTTGYAPMEEAALRRYAFFRRLGFFGVEGRTARGAAVFLRTAATILARPGAVLWLTPQGRFADVRERPLGFRAGLGHLAARCAGHRSPRPSTGSPPEPVTFLPLAIEYTHWEERLPEVLVRFGEPLVIDGSDSSPSPDHWTSRCEGALEGTMDALARGACARTPGRFRNLLAGAAGVGGVYDAWRRVTAAVRGRSFRPEHGRL